MTKKQLDTKDQIFGFLNKHSAQIVDIEECISVAEHLVLNQDEKFLLSTFKNLKETLVFSDLLIHGLQIDECSKRDAIIDLGAGSSLPTILALKYLQNTSFNVLSIDNDDQAIKASNENIIRFNLTQNYTIEKSDILDFLKKFKFNLGQIIVSNPAYMPVPKSIKHNNYRIVDGGEDGTKYLELLLSKQWEKDTVVILQFCTLSNPLKIIRMIEESYEILFLKAYKSPFGKYSGASDIKPYLELLREKGLAFFEPNNDGEDEFLYLGCVLKA